MSLHSSLFPPDLSLCSINFTLFLPPLLFSNEHILSLIFPVSHCSYCSSRLLKLSTRLSVSFNTKGKVALRRTRDVHLYPLPDCSCQPQSEALVQRGCLQQKQDAVFIFKFWWHHGYRHAQYELQTSIRTTKRTYAQRLESSHRIQVNDPLQDWLY